ncbi:Disulfide-bond oxidoreductase YfcG [Thalassovita gelatinovora]|uniref:Disulfide-bond oxidoreductase YfcG n=1 Tax=Thalassovita gelatinovora TaxID=53501 RepID=A0A0N7LV41_THAGE|nr:glutathione S-transferase [Thalassovita gelatinovora]QIZ80674.1 glutathione S-transferase [Thalassovita gelatinovora]CUH65242.1 Disulfide-bond oxidoreductase YfcG [Thalassovita gelatinovora]SEQ88149.1 glutathione S-transferase [Thalassovita gelatinovora]
MKDSSVNPHFPAGAAPVKLYRNPKSGHCHRVQLMMSLLGVPYEPVDMDMANGAHKASEYLKISPFGQVPAIDDNGITLSDSNAILTYLVRKYPDGHDWLPAAPEAAAEVQRWLSVAAGEIASGPAAARLAAVFGAKLDRETAKAKAHRLFAVMEPLMQSRPFLAGPAVTIADIAGYSYIAHAPEGGVSLEAYPAIHAWLDRIEALPDFVGMARSPIPSDI